MTIKELRASTGLSQQAFADKYGIPKKTIQNWESQGKEHRECPDYVKKLLERAVKTDNKIIIDNQTNLPDNQALVMIVGCLADLENGYKVIKENDILVLKESTR